jgi:biotin carboxyl carrier protein
VRLELEIGDRMRVVTIERLREGIVVAIDGRPVEVEAVALEPGRWSVRLPASGRQHEVMVTSTSDPSELDVAISGWRVPVRRRVGRGRQAAAKDTGDGPYRVVAPMPGKVLRVLVVPGQAIELRQGVVVVEAMKMENELRAPRAGVVREVLVQEGASVDAGAGLVVIE